MGESKLHINQEIPEEDIKKLATTLGAITVEVTSAIVKVSLCAEALLTEVMEVVKKINKQLYEVYLAEGAPLGDSQVGFYLWLKEKTEKESGQNG